MLHLQTFWSNEICRPPNYVAIRVLGLGLVVFDGSQSSRYIRSGRLAPWMGCGVSSVRDEPMPLDVVDERDDWDPVLYALKKYTNLGLCDIETRAFTDSF